MDEYHEQYFRSGIFDCNYKVIAECINDIYAPHTAIDVGCGPAYLTRAMANLAVTVTAVDGYAQPALNDSTVAFFQLDLNSSEAVEAFFVERRYDVAICLEVAEHLEADAADRLVAHLTTIAPVVVFSAAIPDQGGHGHINLRPRNYWHEQFTSRGFLCADRLRERLRGHPDVAPWYRFNTLDYVHGEHPSRPETNEVISRLITSESVATSAMYAKSNMLTVAQARLSYWTVRTYLSLRGLARRIRHRH